MKHNPNQTNKEEQSVQSVVRAIQILEAVVEHMEPITIQELVEKTNLNRTTVWRLLVTLENLHYVERDPITKGYQIGYAPNRLFAKTDVHGPLVRRARPLLEKLRDETDETVHLSVPKHNGTLTVDQIDAPRSIRVINYVNRFLPSHCTSNGKVLLSRLSNEELHILLDRSLEKVTPYTITTAKELMQEIEWVRKHGYGLAIREWDESENGISAPILSEQQELIGFVSVLGPYFRLPKEKMTQMAETIQQTAHSIAKELN
ncbi:IclR family transcriptional regulator [Pontibacillus salicampi]|uniref:IclR family transcriptional regulator n=1 Tax=Pontibacillus salicampi TaxID=1449801 RepID=A0ABV6LRY4_9BACI